MKQLICAAAVTLALAGCGGGGGGGTPVPATPSAAPIEAFSTSYENAKLYGLSRITFPTPQVPVAWGAGDFFRRGSIDLFTSKINYNVSSSYATVTSDARYLSDFQFWRRQGDGTFSLAATYAGCLHPRKGVVADFNRDGYPDVFVACHGYDAPVNGAFPGEKSKLLLSDGKGGFAVKDVGAAGFYHGAAAGDVNGDGFPDIVVANFMNPGGPNVHFLMNQKDGTFQVDNTRVPGQAGSPFFSAELLDVNGDGLLDLAVGGHEPSAETAILYGSSSGVFGNTKTVVAPVAGRGVVLDFTVVSNNGRKVLYVARSADGSAPGFPFYSTQTLQAVNLSTNASSTLVDALGAWVAWWLPTSRSGSNGVSPYASSNPDLFFSP